MKIDKFVIIRTLVLLVALINQLLAAFGKSPLPFGEQEIIDVVVNLDLVISTLITIVSATWAWWKDNDITEEARKKKARD